MVRQSYRPLLDLGEKPSLPKTRPAVTTNERTSGEERLGITRRPVSAGRTRFFGESSKKPDATQTRSNRRSESNGRGVNNDQQNTRVTATISNRRAVSSGRGGIYERCLEYQAKREEKLKILRKEMMEECTFTPKTLQTMSSASRTSTTNASSDTKMVVDDVYERLYRHVGNVSTPQKPRSRAGSSTLHPTPTSGMSRSGSACSSRIEELYQEGKRKIRSRRLTERQERILREMRREQQDILQCTFRPKTQWKGHLLESDKGHNLGRIGISPRDEVVRSPPTTRKKRTNCPPQEILVASPSDIRHWTPQRNKASTTPDYAMVSPIADPTVCEESASIDDSTLLPRMHFIGSTVGTSTAVSVSQLTHTDATEYGSI